MKQVPGIVNTIENILHQVDNTTIDTGKNKGHYISSAQFQTLQEAVNSPITIAQTADHAEASSSKASAPSTVDLARKRESTLHEQLRIKEIELSASSAVNRPRVNEELGQLKQNVPELEN